MIIFIFLLKKIKFKYTKTLNTWFDTSQFENRVNDFKSIKRMDAIMERYRDGRIPIEKLSFSVSTKVEVFPWIDKWLGIAIQNDVKDLEFGYMDSGYSTLLYLDPLPVFTMLTAKSLRKLVVKDCHLTKATLWSSGSVATYYDSLRELSLLGVRLNDNMLQTLLAICPMIVHFTIKHCVGLSKIELRNLQKIKMVSIYMDRKQPVEIQTPTLEYCFCCGHTGNFLDLEISVSESEIFKAIMCEDI